MQTQASEAKSFAIVTPSAKINLTKMHLIDHPKHFKHGKVYPVTYYDNFSIRENDTVFCAPYFSDSQLTHSESCEL